MHLNFFNRHTLFGIVSIVLFTACNAPQKNNLQTDEDVNRLVEENKNLRRSFDSLNTVEAHQKGIDNGDTVNQQSSASQNSFASSTKYVLIKVLTVEPTGTKMLKGTSGFYDGRYHEGVPAEEVPNWEKFVYNSDIIRVDDYSENKKFELMDDYISKIDLKWIMLSNGSGTNTIRGKVTDRQCLEFNSYAEASNYKFIHKSEY